MGTVLKHFAVQWLNIQDITHRKLYSPAICRMIKQLGKQTTLRYLEIAGSGEHGLDGSHAVVIVVL